MQQLRPPSLPQSLTVDELKNLLHESSLRNSDRLLLCLATGEAKNKTVAETKAIAVAAGFSKAKSLNISSVLSRTKGLAIRTTSGWELTGKGLVFVQEISGKTQVNNTAVKVATNLRAHLSKLSDDNTRSFVAEAIGCFENELYRASVVLTWVGAVSVLYDHVLTKHLAVFNAEATRRNTKWKVAKTKDDLALMGEYDFLQVLAAISVIGKSVKEELEGCLKLRNGCGHPNSLKVGDTRVAAHIETLMQNVFEPFS